AAPAREQRLRKERREMKKLFGIITGCNLKIPLHFQVLRTEMQSLGSATVSVAAGRVPRDASGLSAFDGGFHGCVS
ncbi:MAG TPA: hypothetical protein VGR14_10060, partial [Verrucomicrobiae bacterium]|nr:hypothetical protein [Verrucomicrobiae bacterium]